MAPDSPARARTEQQPGGDAAGATADAEEMAGSLQAGITRHVLELLVDILEGRAFHLEHQQEGDDGGRTVACPVKMRRMPKCCSSPGADDAWLPISTSR